MPIRYTTKEFDEFTLVEGVIEGGVLGYEEFADAIEKAPEVDTTKGVCISGRMPVWMFVGLGHKYHPTKFVAVYEPRLNSCFVTSSHTTERKVGDILKL